MTTKTCTKCGETKPLDDFADSAMCAGGRNTQCRECVAEYGRAYRATHKAQRKAYYTRNRDRFLAWQRDHRAKHKEEHAARQRRYVAENKEKVAESQRRYREKHKEALAAYQKEYYKANKARLDEYRRKYYAENKERHTAWRLKRAQQAKEGKLFVPVYLQAQTHYDENNGEISETNIAELIALARGQ